MGIDILANTQMPVDFAQTFGRQHPGIACQRRFVGIGTRHDQCAPGVPDRERCGQHTAGRPHGAGERELADEFVVGENQVWSLLAGDENTDGNRQVETPAFLGKIRGRKIDRDTAGRKFEAAVHQCAAHAVPALPDGGRRESDDGPAWQSAREMNFHSDERRRDAEARASEHDCERSVPGAGFHASTLTPGGVRAQGQPARI